MTIASLDSSGKEMHSSSHDREGPAHANTPLACIISWLSMMSFLDPGQSLSASMTLLRKCATPLMLGVKSARGLLDRYVGLLSSCRLLLGIKSGPGDRLVPMFAIRALLRPSSLSPLPSSHICINGTTYSKGEMCGIISMIRDTRDQVLKTPRVGKISKFYIHSIYTISILFYSRHPFGHQ